MTTVSVSTTYTYDDNGNLTKSIESIGTTTYTYDYENRLTKITYPDSTTSTFTYAVPPISL